MNATDNTKRIAFFTGGFTGSTLPLAKRFIEKGFAVDFYLLRGEVKEMEGFDCTFSAKGHGIEQIPESKYQGLCEYMASDSFKLYAINLPRPYKSVPILRNLIKVVRKCIARRCAKVINAKGYWFVNLVTSYKEDSWLLFDKHIRLKKIISLHEVSDFKYDNMEYRPTRFLSHIFKQGYPIVVYSQNALRQIANYKEVNLDNVHLVHFGLFETYLTVKEEKVDCPHDYILFFGGILPYKGLSTLYDCVNLHREYFKEHKVVVAGNGKDMSLDKMLTDDLFFCINRRLSSGELTYLIKNAKVIVCPYLTMSQSGIPQTVMAYDKPIVATKLPAFEEILKDEVNSLLIEVDDSEGLYNQICRIYDDDNLYYRLTEKIKSFESDSFEFSWNNICQQYLKIMKVRISNPS